MVESLLSELASLHCILKCLAAIYVDSTSCVTPQDQNLVRYICPFQQGDT